MMDSYNILQQDSNELEAESSYQVFKELTFNL